MAYTQKILNRRTAILQGIQDRLNLTPSEAQTMVQLINKMITFRLTELEGQLRGMPDGAINAKLEQQIDDGDI